jgi:hypothetical protein
MMITMKCSLKNGIWFTAVRIAVACAVAFLSCSYTAAATQDDLAQARREDHKLCSTPEGMMYEVKFLAAVTPKAIAAVDSCTASTKKYDFDMAFKVSSEGKITHVVYTQNQPVATCVAAKLQGVVGPKPLRGPCTIFGHYSSKPK